MSGSPALCEFAHHLILRAQRMAGSTGRTAADRDKGEGQVWAVPHHGLCRLSAGSAPLVPGAAFGTLGSLLTLEHHGGPKPDTGPVQGAAVQLPESGLLLVSRHAPGLAAHKLMGHSAECAIRPFT